MGTIEEIKQMQQQGKTEQEISQILMQRGFSPEEISSSFSQAQIKNAVTDNQMDSQSEDTMAMPPIPQRNQFQMTPPTTQPSTQEYSEMSPSVMSQQEPYSQEYVQEPYQQYREPYQQYQDQYQQYQPSISADTMTEIAEQIMAEKLSSLTNKIEKAVDTKATFETKISSLSERIQRIEKIIDKLQLSVLQKVGEYVTDVSDLKKELIETQKTFKAEKKPRHKK